MRRIQLIWGKQRLPCRQVRSKGHDEEQALPFWLHSRHRLRRWHPLQRRWNRLLSLKGRGSLLDADVRLPACRHGDPMQRDMPRYNRDGHDVGHVRDGEGTGHG